MDASPADTEPAGTPALAPTAEDANGADGAGAPKPPTPRRKRSGSTTPSAPTDADTGPVETATTETNEGKPKRRGSAPKGAPTAPVAAKNDPEPNEAPLQVEPVTGEPAKSDEPGAAETATGQSNETAPTPADHESSEATGTKTDAAESDTVPVEAATGNTDPVEPAETETGEAAETPATDTTEIGGAETDTETGASAKTPVADATETGDAEASRSAEIAPTPTANELNEATGTKSSAAETDTVPVEAGTGNTDPVEPAEIETGEADETAATDASATDASATDASATDASATDASATDASEVGIAEADKAEANQSAETGSTPPGDKSSEATDTETGAAETDTIAIEAATGKAEAITVAVEAEATDTARGTETTATGESAETTQTTAVDDGEATGTTVIAEAEVVEAGREEVEAGPGETGQAPARAGEAEEGETDRAPAMAGEAEPTTSEDDHAETVAAGRTEAGEAEPTTAGPGQTETVAPQRTQAGVAEAEAEAVGAEAAVVVVGEGVAEKVDRGPRHAIRGVRVGRLGRRKRIIATAVPMALLLTTVVGWAVDSASRSEQVSRNVDLAGQDISGLDEPALRQVTAGLAAEQAARPVTIEADGKTYETTAGALGLAVDQEATVDAAMDVGHDGSPLLRPFRWAGSFVRSRDLGLQYTVDDAQAEAALVALQGADRTAPVEPSMPMTDTGLVIIPGQPGQGLEPGTVVDELLEAAATSPDGTLALAAEPVELAPRFTDAEAQRLADQANAVTAAGLGITVSGVEVTVPAEQLRAWMVLTAPADELELAVDQAALQATLPPLVGPVGPAPVNASMTLDGAGIPMVVPGSDGIGCCQADSGARVWEALRARQPTVELATGPTEPEWTTDEVQSWGITQPIGGSRAWRNGGEVPGPAPGFTTYHDCCASRVTNIQRLADLVRGALIPPGGDFSINDYVGPRTSAKGFVLAGAIANGLHVDEIGGGVSQFATTTFNAAYFAGLDITDYQAHTEYFPRYPRGREATMGYPNPDLAIHNNTPYGLLIWTSYTGTSLTVTFYSTPWATAEQTGISQSSSGACRNVSTTRTRWFPDGTTAEDTFSATYRPGEGRFC